MAAPRLQPGERVVFTTRPGAFTLYPAYIFTLGLYELTRRQAHFTVTDQRVIHSSGLLTRRERSVPVDQVQDAAVVTQLGVGKVVVSTAGGRLSTLIFGPMGSKTAHRMAEVILAQRATTRQQLQQQYQPQAPAYPQQPAYQQQYAPPQHQQPQPAQQQYQPPGRPPGCRCTNIGGYWQAAGGCPVHPQVPHSPPPQQPYQQGRPPGQ